MPSIPSACENCSNFFLTSVQYALEQIILKFENGELVQCTESGTRDDENYLEGFAYRNRFLRTVYLSPNCQFLRERGKGSVSGRVKKGKTKNNRKKCAKWPKLWAVSKIPLHWYWFKRILPLQPSATSAKHKYYNVFTVFCIKRPAYDYNTLILKYICAWKVGYILLHLKWLYDKTELWEFEF